MIQHGVRLTPAQRRHLEVSLGQILREVDEAIVWFDRWPLSDARQEETLKKMEAVQSRILIMATELGLAPIRLRPDPRQKLEALVGEWWSTVLDCRSEVLRGYGEVDPATGPRLDPLVEELASFLLRLPSSPTGQG
jgi:hypothetical protein